MNGFLIMLLHCCFPCEMCFVKNRYCMVFSICATCRYMKKYVNFSVEVLMLSHAIHITLLRDQFYMRIECWDKANTFIPRKYFAKVSVALWNLNCDPLSSLKLKKKKKDFITLTSNSSTWRCYSKNICSQICFMIVTGNEHSSPISCQATACEM